MFKKTIITIVVSLLLGVGSGFMNNGTYSDGSIVIGDGSTEFVPFVCENMLPGDVAREAYVVTAVDKSVTALRFKVHVSEQSGKLSEVLRITVRADGIALYDGTMADMDKYVRVEVPEDRNIEFMLTVYLGTEVTSEYAGKHALVDFEWAAMDGDYDGPVYPDTNFPSYPEPEEPVDPQPPVDPDEPDDPVDPQPPVDPDEPDDPVDPDEPSEPDDPGDPQPPAEPPVDEKEKCCPWCFDVCPWCYIIPIIVMACGGVLIVYYVRKKIKHK